jgi:8-oxo-dGTP diphosphatase
MNSEELLEIVDENNNLTSEIQPRSVVHSQGLWHRTVHIYVFRETPDKDIEFLIQLRSAHKDLNPNCWDLRFGGHIKAGHDIPQTIHQEMKDEIGLDIMSEDLIEGMWRKRNKYPNNEFTKVFYLNFVDHTDDLKFNDNEVQRVEWMPKKEIKESMKSEPEMWAGKLDGFEEVLADLATKI